MLTLALVFIGISIVTIHPWIVTCQYRDINDILENLKIGQKPTYKLQEKPAKFSDHALDNTYVLQLLKKLSDEMRTEKKENYNKLKGVDELDGDVEDERHESVDENDVIKVLSEQRGPKKSKQRLNRLGLLSNSRMDEKLNINDYSKIYLVLDPKANLGSRDITEISSIVSKLLTKPNPKVRRYKGFRVSDDSKPMRRILDSKGPYEPGEGNYKKKRGSRNEHRGGGGSRTAIPYVRQRDIFEKANE